MARHIVHFNSEITVPVEVNAESVDQAVELARKKFQYPVSTDKLTEDVETVQWYVHSVDYEDENGDFMSEDIY